jgi:beta-glucosidase
MRFLFGLAVASALLCLPLKCQEQIPAYKDPKLSVEDRVSDLLSRMTLEEKVAQISGGGENNEGLIDSTGKLPYKNAEEVFKELYDVANKIGPRQRALIHNALQRYQLQKTRLGIPDIFFGEGLHGYMAYGSTSFPQALGLASTWDPVLVQKVFTAVGEEMGASGEGQAFTPVLDLARDPR